jgi:hypothetical protein
MCLRALASLKMMFGFDSKVLDGRHGDNVGAHLPHQHVG